MMIDDYDDEKIVKGGTKTCASGILPMEEFLAEDS